MDAKRIMPHGGEITAANRLDGGAAFLIMLPCAAESPEVTLDELTSSADS
jgi:signal transduction histidine kinase